MKRNKVLRIAIVLLALVLVSTLGMTGTLARYVAEFDGASATVRAGLFRVTVDDTTPAALSPVLYRFNDDGTVAPTLAASSNGDNIIVPGTLFKADSAFTVYNDSEVAVDIGLALPANPETFLSGFTTTAGAAALQFSFNEGGAWHTIAELGAAPGGFDLGAALLPTPIVLAPGASDDLDISVWVRWVFSVNAAADEDIDTVIGLRAADAILGIPAVCVCEGLAPEAPCENAAGCSEAVAPSAPTDVISLNFGITATQVNPNA